ncbi:MAG TPA: hypothetical protein VIM80_02385 [Brevefilum sp.]
MRATDEQKPNKRNRKITVIILSLLGLCLLTVGISFISNQFLPKASSTPDKLSQEDLYRAEETLNLMDRLGDQTWHGLNASMPLLLFNDSHAFLINSQENLAGWHLLEGAQVNEKPVYVQEKERDYQAFTERLSNGQYAGSMTTKNATNVGFINLFKQDLPPVISQVFPYRLMLLSTDHYITALVHESFHAYQAENYPARFEDAEKAYRSTEAYENLYPEMGQAWETEVQYLIDAVEETDPSNQIELVRSFLNTREQRRNDVNLSKAFELYEKRFEWLEGSAKYVELETWENASDAANYQPISSILEDKDFDAYQGYEKRWKNEINNAKTAAKNGSETLFYYSGMLQARLLDILMPDWQTKIGEPDIWYEDLLADAIS